MDSICFTNHSIKLICLITFLALISACQNTNDTNIETSIKGETTIGIHPNVQLLRIAYNLAIADSLDIEYQPCNNTLYQNTQLQFNEFSQLPLVQKIRNGDEWNADLPVIALCFDEDFNILSNIDNNTIESQFGWYGENLDSLSILLKDFKIKTNYKNTEIINFKPFLSTLKNEEIPNKLNSFFRQDKQPNLDIIFDPQNNITNKAITFLNKESNKRKFLLGYFCDHPDSTAQHLDLKWDDDYRRIVFHENSHLYTDDLLKTYYDSTLDSLINQSKFEDIYIDIDEIIVRGITAKILEVNYGKEIGKYEISIQSEQSKIIYDILDQYLEDESLTFESIYIKMIEALKKEYL